MKKIVLVILFLSSMIVYGETEFIDVESTDWYYEYIQYLSEHGIVSGYEDQTFRPSQNMTIEEFVTLTMKAMNKLPLEQSTDHWSDGYIAKAISLNIIAEHEFHVYSKPITRGEMARIALRTGLIQVPEEYMNYARSIQDLDLMQEYWQNIAIRIYASGVLSGYPNGDIQLDGWATRGEASVILARLMHPPWRKIPDLEWRYNNRVSAIKAEWLMRQPITKEHKFDVMPEGYPIYEPGVPHNHVVVDALNMLKFLRFLSGVSNDIFVSDTANDLAQHGALLIGTSEFSHKPSRPVSMDETLYQKGYEATSTSNLASGVKMPSMAIKRLMDDSDVGNIEVLGHRRWQLAPDLNEFGIGYVTLDNEDRYFTVAKMFKNLQTIQRPYTKIYWPSHTAFPVDFFGDDVPWSVSLNPNIYDRKKTEDIMVTLVNTKTNETIVFDKKANDLSGKFFNVDIEGYGVPFCIIFRPDPQSFDGYDVDTLYHITIEHIYLKDGTETTIQYQTKFFRL